MVLPPVRWAYRRAARWRFSVLTVTLVVFTLVGVQRRLEPEQYFEPSQALGQDGDGWVLNVVLS